jgi:hypothetical protein
MDKKTDMDELAEYYDNTDTSELMADAVLETDTVRLSDVWVTTSLRLPQPVLSEVRKAAKRRGGKVTASDVMREWIEAGLAAEHEYADKMVSLAAVRSALLGVLGKSAEPQPITPPHRHASPRKKASKKAGQAAAKAALRKV